MDPAHYAVSAPSLAASEFTTGAVVVSGYVSRAGRRTSRRVSIMTTPVRPIRLEPGEGPGFAPPDAALPPGGFAPHPGGHRWRGPRP